MRPTLILVAACCAAASTFPAAAQETTRVSVDSAGVEGDGDSDGPAISGDGRFVAVFSFATNLVASDNNGMPDIFVHDRVTGTTERVSVATSGAEANGWNGGASISADGQLVAFFSAASNLVAGDTNGTWDIFVHDRAAGVTERVSVDSSGGEANSASFFPAISADGRFVAFTSFASNLVAGDGNSTYDVFVHDRATGVTERVSVDSTGAEAHGDSGAYGPPALSADGQIVAFDSEASDLVAGDTNKRSDAFVHDRASGITELVSVDSAGVPGNDLSYLPSISADGRVVAFASIATNLVVHDLNGFEDVFVHDRTTGLTERVSVRSSGAQGNRYSNYPSLSADGRFVAFESAASNLVAGDTNALTDVFVHDRVTGMTARANVDSSGAQSSGDSGMEPPALSADGLIIAFGSHAPDLVANDTNGVSDVFAHETCPTSASWSNYGAGFPGTNGVPAFTSQQNPVLGSTITLDLDNSYAQPTVGLLFIGFQRTSIHSSFGGDLLVAPALTMNVTFSFGSDSFTGAIPADLGLCGTTVDLQALEADPGAAKGVSFTAGLELVLGR